MEPYQILTIVVSFLGAILGGALIPWFNSKKDRESREQIFEDEKQHKIILFELEKKHKEEMFELERKDRQEKFEMEQKDKFKMVSIEKRLAAHQQALVYWYEMREILYGKVKNKNEIIQNLKNFWKRNALYLEKETRKRFYQMIYTVMMNENKINDISTRENEGLEEYSKEIKKDWDELEELFYIIFSEVEIEPIKITEPEKQNNSELDK